MLVIIVLRMKRFKSPGWAHRAFIHDNLQYHFSRFNYIPVCMICLVKYVLFSYIYKVEDSYGRYVPVCMISLVL